MKLRFVRNISVAVSILFFLQGITAQIVPGQVEDKKPDDTINVETTLVNIPLIISDKSGKRISDIRKEDISVFAGQKKLDISFFADSNEPVTYAILIDTSGSARSVIGRIKNASKSFVGSMEPEDRGIVFGFDESVNKMMKGFSSDRDRLRSALNAAQISQSPGSVMNDALERIVRKEFAEIKGRKAIIVLTDGDVHGKSSVEDIVRMFAQSDVVVYPIFYQTRPLLPPAVKSVSFADLVKIEPVKYLYSLAKVTGGRLLVAESEDFETAFKQISEELGKQYVVGFYADAPDSNSKAVNISINVNRSDVVVRTKQSIRVRVF